MSNLLHNFAAIAPPVAPKHLDEAYRSAAETLRRAGVASPELDARLLICHACGLSHEQFAAHPERALSGSERERLDTYIQRRCAREPVSRITGTREFWGLEFKVSPHVLDPRPDTETLVGAALELVKDRDPSRPLSILDLGTGSGCILVSLLNELKPAHGVGVDVSQEALSNARENARRHGCADRACFVRASWADSIAGRFDLVVSNPPYISTLELAGLEPEVRLHDPARALDGGDDGLEAYRQILCDLASVCAPGGWVLFEVGQGQAGDVSTMIAAQTDAFYSDSLRRWRDLAGRVRCIGANRSPTL